MERPESGWSAEPVDPDTADQPDHHWLTLLGTIAAGGALGALARYAAGQIWPSAPGAFPWTTFWVNVVGCALMGVLMVLVTERYAAPPLLRPFLGTGILGGFTTFSTYAVDGDRLLRLDATGTALIYVAATLVAAGLAVWAGATVTRRLAGATR